MNSIRNLIVSFATAALFVACSSDKAPQLRLRLERWTALDGEAEYISQGMADCVLTNESANTVWLLSIAPCDPATSLMVLRDSIWTPTSGLLQCDTGCPMLPLASGEACKFSFGIRDTLKTWKVGIAVGIREKGPRHKYWSRAFRYGDKTDTRMHEQWRTVGAALQRDDCGRGGGCTG